MEVRIGTRKSRLARVQTEGVAKLLEKQGLSPKLILMESLGDQQTQNPLYAMEGAQPGVFTKQLEQALLDDQIDLAVHSLKDLPTKSPEGLVLAAVSKRANTADTLVIRKEALDPEQPLSLCQNARVGTSSLRRQAQLFEMAPQALCEPIRGNVPTRVEKVRSGEVDAAILAQAGLDRLELDLSDLTLVPLDEKSFVPAPGQGALALQVHQRCPAPLREALAKLEDPTARIETTLERRILSTLEGGCSLPLGVRCWKDKGSLKISAFLGISEGTSTASSHPWISFKRWTGTGTDPDQMVDTVVSQMRS